MKYSRTAMVLHWLTAILVVATFIMGPGGSEARVYSAAKDFDRILHELLGLSVFLLVLLRLAWRLGHRAPELAGVPPLMKTASRAVQHLLYGLLLLTPLTAISGAWLEGHPLTLGPLGEIGPLLAKNRDLGRSIAEVHTWLGDAVIWLAGLHAAAALFHHFVLRDGVLLSMLPGRR
ncbi:MAG TPA: cytochrome b/b6 domain-containing protein [Burkholderiales bacterium]|nr:cytochrome b/b6 domain-containing protein [Burkholderiales bacterium]